MIWLHLWDFNDNHIYIFEGMKYICGFYIAFYVVEGCFYVK